MIGYINNLKTKPDHIKKRFAFVVSFAVSFLIFAGWIASYGLSSSPVLADKDSSVESPVSSLTASVGNIFSDIKNFFLGSNEAEYSADSITVEPGNR